MELNHSLYFVFKVGVNFVTYKWKQFRLVTRETEVIQTSCGKVRGVKLKNTYGDEHNYYAFEGIPYAKPPVGELRFRAPQPPDPWENILECRHYRSKPSQFNMLFKIPEGSEDCLYLNVYAKKLSSKKPLPVMVWIYGGGFQSGEASRDIYSPEYFMQQDVIFVTLNYRLGVFGFLCFDSPDLNIPGNAGIKDQLLALKWIKENIHNFNGDNNNITLFGESAGGVSTQMLMLTPRAEGLFHKAILQSASVLCHWAYTERHDWGYKLARHLGYKGENNDGDVYRYLVMQDRKRFLGQDKFLLDKPDVLMENLFCVFVPVIEPYVTSDCIVCRPFEELLPNAWSNNIPLIIGGNANEGIFNHSMLVKYPFLLGELNDISYVSFLPKDVQRSYSSNDLRKMGQQLKEIYFNGEIPSVTDHLHQYLDLVGDNFFWLPMHRIIKARSLYAPNVPTYCYCFEFDSPNFNHARSVLCTDASIRGACHGDELSYLFGNLMSGKLLPTQREYTCMQRMISMWYNFALTSNPNCKEIAPTVWKWMEHADKPIHCLTINDNVKFTKLPNDERLRKWHEFYNKVAQF